MGKRSATHHVRQLAYRRPARAVRPPSRPSPVRPEPYLSQRPWSASIGWMLIIRKHLANARGALKAMQQNIERPRDGVLLMRQRCHARAQLAHRNRGDRLRQHDVRTRVDVKDRVQFPDRRRRVRQRQERRHGPGRECAQQLSLNINDISNATAAGHRVDVKARHQNWRKAASGTPFCST